MSGEILLELSLKIPLQAESWNISPSKARAVKRWKWSSSRTSLEKPLHERRMHFTAGKPRTGTIAVQDRVVSEPGTFNVIYAGFWDKTKVKVLPVSFPIFSITPLIQRPPPVPEPCHHPQLALSPRTGT